MRAALKQGIGLLLVLAVACVAAAWFASRPLDARSLHVRVSKQQSLAAEAAILVNQWNALPLGVAREHARHLARQITSGVDSLRSARVEPGVQAARDSALTLGRRLLDEAVALDSRDAAVDAGPFANISRDLKSLDASLQRAAP